jgi:hypothetical protein
VKFDDLKSAFEPAPEGPHTAVLVAAIDRGEQAGKYEPRRQMVLHWLLPNVETANGDPCLVFQTIWNVSMRARVFREIVQGLMGGEPLEGRSLRELVGRVAKITVVHNEGESQTYANIASVKPMKPGTKAPKIETELVYFSLDTDEFDEKVLNSLSEHDQTKIKSSRTYLDLKFLASAKDKSAADIIDDDFPEALGGAPKSKKRAA